MAHSLPPLPYPSDALEPHIDKQTMEIHHGKHHNAYVTNLNTALGEASRAAVEERRGSAARASTRVPEDIRTAVRNNGGGHVNHTMFWQIMGPNAGGAADRRDRRRDQRRRSAASTSSRKQLKKAGVGRFGSGWAWLIDQRRQARRSRARRTRTAR